MWLRQCEIVGPGRCRSKLAQRLTVWSGWLATRPLRMRIAFTTIPRRLLRKFSGRQTAVTGLLLLAALLISAQALARDVTKKEDLWSLKPVVAPEIPKTASLSTNPIDQFISAASDKRAVLPLGPADKLTWLRRVTYDLAGLPPTVAEQDAFLTDESPRATENVVDRLLASEQYGVRYGRHWLDVLRYADADENMPAAPGIHLWRDWVISALNQDLPFDAFARAQICGNRARARIKMSAAGHRMPVEPRTEDLFALGFLARGATDRSNGDQQLAMSAVETISSAFMGMTVGCAKCHDHFYDPITQGDYYSMKALFDPLVLRPLELATAEERFARGLAVEEYENRKAKLEESISRLIEPYRARLYEERLSMLPPEVQPAIRKPEKERTAPEQKIFDDYFPILRIDPPKVKEIMPAGEAKEYDAYLKQVNALKAPDPLPVFWTVEEDPKRQSEKSFVLTSGDPKRPRLNQEVQPGFPFAPDQLEFRDGRRETFVDWLTAPENPLFARVAVNRIWQWHFGGGLHRSASDFGTLGGEPAHPKLLDWLSSEFVAHDYSMKWLHRLIVTSETYRRASSAGSAVTPAGERIDPDDVLLWRFPFRRLEAEPIRDAMLLISGQLDFTTGGKSFDGGKPGNGSFRRAAYMSRGFRSDAELMPDFLAAFDAEDGRAVCPRRNQTVTAPQALFMMNHQTVEEASARFASRLQQLSTHGPPDEDLVARGFRMALGRPPTEHERASALDYLGKDGQRIKGFAWLLMNLDEFVYLR